MSLFDIFTSRRSIENVHRGDVSAAASTDGHQTQDTILVALTGDALDADTVSLACTMARARQITVVHAVYAVDVPRALAVTDELPEAQRAAHAAFEMAAQAAAAYHVGIEAEYIQSRNSADALVRVARSEQYALLVMGLSNAKNDTATDPKEMVDDVLRRAPCRVLVVRDAPLAA